MMTINMLQEGRETAADEGISSDDDEVEDVTAEPCHLPLSRPSDAILCAIDSF